MDGYYDIPDLVEITPRIATAGQPGLEQLEAVADRGYEVVINLNCNDSDSSLDNEAAWVKQLGMAYVHIPVEFGKPGMRDFTRFLNAMNLHQGKRCFIHAAGNKRVSVFVSLYQIIANEITAEVGWLHINSIWEPDFVWTSFFHEVLKAFVTVIRNEN